MSEDSRIYNFFGWNAVNSFFSANMHKLFPSVTGGEQETGTLLLLKNKVDLFKQVCRNTHGGCPCNKAKRVQQAVDTYKEVVDVFSKCEEARASIFESLGNPDFLHFYETDNPQALRESQQQNNAPPPEPFAKVAR